MKKTINKKQLRLSTETVRTLHDGQLQQVVGAGFTDFCQQNTKQMTCGMYTCQCA